MATPASLIALEEHFAAPGLLPEATEVSFFDPDQLVAIERLLPELAEERLRAMDEAGIQIAVLSQTAPGVQGIHNTSEAVTCAHQANNHLQRSLELHPKRFRGFAALALQDVDAACAELSRCVEELGFVGALVNGCSQQRFLDDSGFASFWRTLERLKVPLYLHPGIPAESPRSRLPQLEGATWAWTADTAEHALRLVVSGVFERHPDAQVILGHMGETLPFLLWRLDSRFAVTRYASQLQGRPSEAIRRHIHITTSGVCDPAPLRCAIETMGIDRVLFATDYPYEDIALAGRWIQNTPLSASEREAIGYQNARQLLQLNT